MFWESGGLGFRTGRQRDLDTCRVYGLGLTIVFATR